jgi:regulator of sigma E protease
MISVLLGLFGLGLVVFVHEAGHFLSAKASGIEVEAFSIGWGRAVLKKQIGNTEYRLGILPIGGYCKMKGEELFRKALAEKAETIEAEKGSLFAAHPLKRIATYAAGPFANLLFAILVLSILWYIGFTIHTFDNRIVLLSDYPELFDEGENPADRAGLESGDRIIGFNGNTISHYTDLQEAVASRAGSSSKITLLREGKEITLTIEPELDKQRGIGKIGVSAWIEPVIAEIAPNSAAALAGLKKGDRISLASGVKIDHYLDLLSILEKEGGKIEISYMRDSLRQETVLIPSWDDEGNPITGISFGGKRVRSPELSLPGAVGKGAGETFSTLFLTVKGLASLFSGVDARETVSGPIRITYLVGEVASRSFQEGIGTGISTLFRFIALISVALCFGNLLPIPALDGGLILLSLVEMVKGSQVSPRTFYRYQTIGFFIILGILILTTFGDISYLMRGV